MDHKDVAQRVLQGVGGSDNLVAAAHCATRLRMVLKDSDKIVRSALDEDPDLKGTFEAGGMFQIIVGPGDVDSVFSELEKIAGKSIAVSTEELKEVAENKGNALSRGIKVLADIFVPLIPILVGGGLLMALNNVLVAEGIFGESSLIQRWPTLEGFASMINLLSAAPFAFLPILVGYTATKRFGGNEFLGAGLGMAMVMPSLTSGYDVAEAISTGSMEYWDLFGLNVAQAGYQGTVLPILVMSWVLANIEKFLRARLRGTVDFLLTPLLTLLLSGFITFIAIGPLMRWCGDVLAHGLADLYDIAGPVGGFLFGLVYSPIVITGLHQSFPPIEMELWKTGGSFIFATASMANIAQGAATLSVFLLSKNEKIRALAGSSGASAVFGITEPAIFGINLRLRWPFYIALGGGALGGLLVALLDIKATALGAAGFVGIASIRSEDWVQFIISAVMVFILTGVAAYSYGRYLVVKNGSIDIDSSANSPIPSVSQSASVSSAPSFSSTDQEVKDGEEENKILDPSQALTVYSPLKGKAIDLSTVSDPMFAQGKLGQGVAIIPEEGKIYAPVSGKIVVAFPTGHAFAIRGTGVDDKAVDILMHIGFDTVNLKGEHFTPYKEKGEEVQAGDLLGEFDIDAIQKAGYDITTPMVISNTRRVGSISTAASLTLPQDIEVGTETLLVAPKEVALQGSTPKEVQGMERN